MPKQEEQNQSGTPEQIDLTVAINDFFRILRKNLIWVVLVIALCAAGFTVYKNYTYSPSYTAASTFVVSTNEQSIGSYYDAAAVRQVAQTFPYILTSDILQRQVAQVLGLDYLPGSIRASVLENTNFLTISVTDSDPQRAYQTLQALLQTFPSISESIIGKVYMELMDETGVPTAPNNAENMKLNLVSGGLVGVVICTAMILVTMFTVRTVRCEEDCLRRINAKCLGSVPWVRRKARSKQTVVHPHILQKHANPDFVEAFRIIRNKIDHSCSGSRVKTILVTSTFAGEGKSTTAVNVALALAQEGKKVALVDCDLRNPSDAEILGTVRGKGLINFLRDEDKIEECSLQGENFLPHGLPLTFIRGGKAVQDGAHYLADHRMKILIRALEKQMDYVILDTPPAGLLTDAAILSQYAQGAVYVVKKDFSKVDKILEGMEHLTQSGTDILGCVLNSGI